MSEDELGTTVSPLKELKSEFATPKAPARLFKRLPAGAGKLVAEYEVIKKGEMEEAVGNEDSVSQDTDLLIRALVAIHRHAPDHEKANARGLVEFGVWAETDFGGPLRFDNRLAEAAGLENGTAREICLQLFDGNEVALSAQASMLTAWMTDTSEEALQDFTEGSSAAR
jgi:hypothetical protein